MPQCLADRPELPLALDHRIHVGAPIPAAAPLCAFSGYRFEQVYVRSCILSLLFSMDQVFDLSARSRRPPRRFGAHALRPRGRANDRARMFDVRMFEVLPSDTDKTPPSGYALRHTSNTCLSKSLVAATFECTEPDSDRSGGTRIRDRRGASGPRSRED